MQLIPQYILNDVIDVISSDAGYVVEYRTVYQKNVKVYKGVDNKLQFRMLNADQKPIRINGKIIEFEAFDDEKDQVLKYEATILDDGSSTHLKGMFTITIPENDLLNIPSQYLSYTVYIKETCDEKLVTYTNRDFGACGIIYVDECASPTIKSSITVNNFYTVNDSWVAGHDELSRITAMPKINKNEALHTAAFYTDAHNDNGYVGNVVIKGTLDNQITGANNWSVIDTVSFDGTETRPVIRNFNGVYSHLRFDADADPTGKLLKILLRN